MPHVLYSGRSDVTHDSCRGLRLVTVPVTGGLERSRWEVATMSSLAVVAPDLHCHAALQNCRSALDQCNAVAQHVKDSAAYPVSILQRYRIRNSVQLQCHRRSDGPSVNV